MTNKDHIIKNLQEINVSEIVQAITQGDVSIYELSKSGKLTPLLRRRIEEQLTKLSEEISTENKVQEVVNEIKANPEVAQTPIIVEAETLQNPVISHSSVDSYNTQAITSTTAKPLNEIIDNKGMFKRSFSFKGRIRRTEFGLSYLIYLIWYIVFISIVEQYDAKPVYILFAILSIVTASWFILAQCTKRCHDRGNSGWYQIIPFYYIIMLFGGGD